MLKLLIRPKPFYTESLQQYILRLAKTNGYTHKKIAKLINKTDGVPIHTCKQDHRENLKTAIIKLTAHNEVQSLFDHKIWHEKYRKIFNYDRVKVCLQCLLINNHCYFHWHFRHTLTCHKHKSLLIDACQSCLEPLMECSLISMRCKLCGCKLLVDSYCKVTIDNRIDDYFSSIEDLDGLYDKIDALKPYFELYQEKSYQLWAKNNSCSIKELVTLISGVLNIFNNKQLMITAFDKLIIDSQEVVSIVNATRRINRFLYHDKYPEFTSLFAEYLLLKKKFYPEMVIPRTFVERLYKVNVMKAKEMNMRYKSEGEELDIVFLWRAVHVISLEKLDDVLKISGYKFS